MAQKFHRVIFNENAYKLFLNIKKRYYERHELNINTRISESDIFIDFYNTLLGDE